MRTTPAQVMHRGRIKSMSKTQRKQLKRRQAVEPTIGHVKHDHRMIRCHLKGSTGDALHAIACAAGYNIRWLMRAMRHLGLKGLFALVALIALCANQGTTRAAASLDPWRSCDPLGHDHSAVMI